MATTKKTTTTRTTRAPARRKAEPSLAVSAERTIKRNPYASAAVATGVVGAIAAAAAGFFAFKKSGKSFTDFSNDVATSAKDKAAAVSDRVKDGLTDAGTKARGTVAKLRDGLDSSAKSQSEIAAEELTRKETGKTTDFTLDPAVKQQTKVGAISY